MHLCYFFIFYALRGAKNTSRLAVSFLINDFIIIINIVIINIHFKLFLIALQIAKTYRPTVRELWLDDDCHQAKKSALGSTFCFPRGIGGSRIENWVGRRVEP